MGDGHKLSRAQKRGARQAKDDASAVLAHPASVRFLCRMLEQSGYFEDQFTGNSETFYRLGRRKTGMDIVNELSLADPDALLKLMQSASKSRGELAAELKADTDET